MKTKSRSSPARRWHGTLRIGEGWALYLGPVFQAQQHAHHATQFCIAIDQPLTLRVAPQWNCESVQVAVIAADTPHVLDGGGESAALLYVEPESELGRSIVEVMEGQSYRVLPPGFAQRLRAVLPKILNQPSNSAAKRLAETFGSRMPTLDLDPRIAAALLAVGNAAGDFPSSAVVASRIGVSKDRLRHLFREQIGLAYRTYLLWRRLAIALDLLRSGQDLTSAAYAAGFSDSAHLSRTFRRMFGIAPSLLAPQSASVPSAPPSCSNVRAGSR